MRAAIPKSEFFNGGSGEEIFTDLLDQEISKVVSKRGIGIADVLYQRLTKS
jgi:Rod binding domain-containing protein